jgi:hypothetical protein
MNIPSTPFSCCGSDNIATIRTPKESFSFDILLAWKTVKVLAFSC